MQAAMLNTIQHFGKEVEKMGDYKKMYYALFNAITESLEVLKKAQLTLEEIFLSSGENELQESETKDSATI